MYTTGSSGGATYTPGGITDQHSIFSTLSNLNPLKQALKWGETVRPGVVVPKASTVQANFQKYLVIAGITLVGLIVLLRMLKK